MTSIPVAICRFFDTNFKRLHLKKERLFVNFWLYFWILDEIWNVLIITEIIASERDVYLSVLKVLLQQTIR